MSDANAARSEDLSKGVIIKGEVFRVEADHVFVKRENGTEVPLHMDQTIKMSDKQLAHADGIVATVNEQNHVLSIHSSDRRRDHMLESGQAVGLG